MDEEDVGSLPVVDEGERLIGIVTDRDVAVRVVGRRRYLNAAPSYREASTEIGLPAANRLGSPDTAEREES